jgi:putative transcriptional regulator
MRPLHHPSDATLMAYAAGALAPEIAAVVAAHTKHCPHCCAELALMDMIGGVLMEAQPEVQLSGAALDKMERTACRCHTNGRPAGPLAYNHDALRTMLLRFTGPDLDRIPWRWLTPGVRHFQIVLPGGNRGGLRFFKLSPGQKIPEHGHRGAEVTFVLTGSYRDCLGRFGPGDFSDLDDEIAHAPVADRHEGCICLAATEHPRQFTGRLPRWLQPLTGL